MPSVKPSYAISTDDACLACKKRGHQIHTCTVFEGRTWADRISVVKDLGLCVNWLRAGHIAEKCRAPSMHHHTLLHRDTDNSTQKKPDNVEAKEETRVAALSVSEQVLLMTCKVKVTAPNGFSTIARVLIDPGSSTSFLHERIAELLRLPRRKKNAMVRRSWRNQYAHARIRMFPGLWHWAWCRENRGRSIRAQEGHKGPTSASYPHCPQSGTIYPI